MYKVIPSTMNRKDKGSFNLLETAREPRNIRQTVFFSIGRFQQLKKEADDRRTSISNVVNYLLDSLENMRDEKEKWYKIAQSQMDVVKELETKVTT